MTEHPLTDDTIRYVKKLGCHDLGTWIYTENDMRAAADWQLEQVIEWAHPILESEHLDGDYFVESLREAMRPQQQPQQEES